MFARYVIPIATLLIMATAVILLYANNPVDIARTVGSVGGDEQAEALAMRGCPSVRFLGLYCPGCGTLRATHHLLHGEVVTSFRYNPLLLLLGLPAATWIAARSIRVVAGKPNGGGLAGLTRPAMSRWVIALPVIIIAWAVVRNIPGRGFDWSRPPLARATSPGVIEGR